jgi:CubicO group peptidase (beta-lactamase class C family)
MSHLLKTAALVASLVLCFILQAQSNISIDTYLRSVMKKKNIPGLQLAVVRNGKIVKLGTYGIANIQDSVPVTNSTVFTINSVTKAFTGVAIMQLVEENKLNLNNPVSAYIDSLPDTWKPVSIKQLLTHTSGIPNIMDDDANMISSQGDEASWKKVQTMPLEFKPGDHFSYNQTNYLLLGKIIDKLTGRPFSQYITEKQLMPAGMHATAKAGFADSYDVVLHRAGGYTYFRNIGTDGKGRKKVSNVHEVFPPFLRTAAGMNSTAKEIAQWIMALQSGRLLKDQKSLTVLWTPGLLNNGTTSGFSNLLNGYSLGWPVVSRPEHPAVASVGGGRSAVFVYPEDNLSVIILTNLQGASPENFIDEVAGFYIPDMKASNGFGLSASAKKLRSELLKSGFEQAMNVVSLLKKADPGFQLSEGELNTWGYKLVEQEKIKEAIEIFKLNTMLYPQSANTFDSLGEAYVISGNTELAIKNYKRSLELYPGNTNAVHMIKALEKR